MVRLVVRRALVQRRLLAGVVVLVTIGTTLLGVCALLLTVTQDRAFVEGIGRLPAQDVDVTAFLVGPRGAEVAESREVARNLVGDVLRPVGSTVTSTAVARMRRLDGAERFAFMTSSDELMARAVLASGRWPDPDGPASSPAEAALPDVAASRLHLALGDRVTLGEEVGGDIGEMPVEGDVTVVVVGTFRARTRAGWETDPLAGAGYDPAWSDGAVTGAAYGPFVVSDASFLATGSSVTSLRVTGHPPPGRAAEPAWRSVVAGLGDADGLLTARVGDRVSLSRVASDLPRTLARVDAQQSATRSTVLVVLLLGMTLSLTALLLAGRLVARVRDEERALLTSFGLGRRQLVVATVAETLMLALAAVALAVPLAALAHARLTHLPALRSAGLRQGADLTWPLVLAVVGGALLATLALVLPVLVPAPSLPALQAASGRRGALLRSGADVLLLTVAGVAWWQLRDQPATAETSGDLILTVAPLVGLVATTLVAVRWVPALLAVLAGVLDRSRTLVLPLAAHQAARRPYPRSALVLVAVGVAAATFGLSLRTTWEQSQDDQAALRVGTDLSLTLSTAVTARDAAAVVAAAGSEPATDDPSDDPSDTPPVVSAVVGRPLALGRYVGETGSPPVIVALDSRRAGTLLRGRIGSGSSWREIGAGLAPGEPVDGVPVPRGGDGLVLTGRAPVGVAVRVTVTLVLQDASGFRTPIAAAPVRLDGRPHRLRRGDVIGAGARLVAVRLQLGAGRASRRHTGEAAVSLTLAIPRDDARADAGPDPPWQVKILDQRDSPLRGVTLTQEATPTGVEIRSDARLDLSYLTYTDGDLLGTVFDPPSEVPVAVSQQLVDATGVKLGGELAATVDGLDLPLRVVAFVPTVPSAPGRVAVLADLDTVSRFFLAAGRLDPVVDGWWVSDAPPTTADALRALDLGDVTTLGEVATQLARGPLRVTVPAALMTLDVAAVVLLLVGAGLALSTDERRRAIEVARLRALGLSRRSARRLILLEHAALLIPLVVAGALVGAAASAALGPDLIRSDVGAAPVPSAQVVWPWGAEASLVGGLLLGCLVAAAVISSFHVRRADPAYLRAGDL